MAILKDTIVQGDMRVTGTIYGNNPPLYGTCSTAAATAAKTVTINNFPGLITGVTVKVKFTYSNTVASPTLNVNGTGAKAIMRYGTLSAATTPFSSWHANEVVNFIYDGTYWQCIGQSRIDIAEVSYAGAIRPWYKHSAAATGPSESTDATAVAVNAKSSTAGRYYPLELDTSGRAFTNVPWTDTTTFAASAITSGTLGVARGGTGAASFTANSAIISGSSTTAALTTRTIRNNTATSSAVTADTALITSNTLRYAINRTTSVAAADTNYTTYMARGQALNTADTNPTVNGAISWTYK